MVPSFEKRVRAFAMDTSPVAIIVLVSAWMGGDNKLIPYLIAGTAFVGFYFFPYFLKSSKGQTFGKRIQKIRIVKLDGSPVELWRVLLRDIFKLALSIGTFSVYLVVSFFVMNEKTGRTIHDYVFKTKIIDLEEPKKKGDNVLGTTDSLRKRGL